MSDEITDLKQVPTAALLAELERRKAITFDYPHVKREEPAEEADQDDEFNDFGDPVGGCYECKYVVTPSSENGSVYRCGLRDSRPIVDPIKGDCVGWDPVDGWQHIPRPVVPTTPVNRFETGELICGEGPGQVSGFEADPDPESDRYLHYAIIDRQVQIPITEAEARSIGNWMRKPAND